MTEIRGLPRAPATRRVALVVSRYHELITGQLLAGARRCCREHGVPDAAVDVLWAPGAFELPVVAEVAAASGRYGAIVALGCVIRGETPHFDYVAGEAARGLGAVARAHRMAVGFGVLTVENEDQARARAGGAAGNKGFEAAEAALATADLLAQLS